MKQLHIHFLSLLERVRLSTPLWKEQGQALINSITKLLALLLDYRAVIEGDENKDKRMSCTVSLLKFYKEEINRNEMYIRYIYKLRDLHLPSENYTEAAFTLKLHADTLNWSWELIPMTSTCTSEHSNHQHHRAREQPEWQLKEQLYLNIIDYFDKGKCWEEGIPLIKELANFYETKLFNYNKWSILLKKQAQFLDNILTQHRPEPEYFRVGFFGLGFPCFLRNKLFIYRGLEYEKIGAFTARLQVEFPAAQVLTRSSPPDASILNSDDQYIQIFSVKPVAEPKKEFEEREVPEKILAYYLTNHVRSFVFDRPIHKGPLDKENEFKSLWIERSTLTISSTLPGILRWFEVTSKVLKELSPLEHACETVENMINELEKLVTSYNFEPSKPISPLSMRLQGVIEAAVNGGVAKYQDAFFNPRFISLHPEQGVYIRRLKQLILQQVRILEGGLALHGRLAPTTIQPLHRRLVERFAFMRNNVMEASSHVKDVGPSYNTLDNNPKRPSIINTPLPPIPSFAAGQQDPDSLSIDSDPNYQLVSQDTPPRNSRHYSVQNEATSADIYALPLDKLNRANCHRNNGLSIDLTGLPTNTAPPSVPDRSSPSLVYPPPPPSRPRHSRESSGLVTPPLRPPIASMGDASPAVGVDSTPPVVIRNRGVPRSAPSHSTCHLIGNFNFYSPDPTRMPVEGSCVDGAPPIPPRGSSGTIDRNLMSPISPEETPPGLPKRNSRRALSGGFMETLGNSVVPIDLNGSSGGHSSLTRRPAPLPPSLPLDNPHPLVLPPSHPPPPVPEEPNQDTRTTSQVPSSASSVTSNNAPETLPDVISQSDSCVNQTIQ